MKRKNTGLTMIELLIVLGIIALLIGLLLPAVGVVRNLAKETKQKAQLSTIEMALATFKNDEGDYPPSNWILPPNPGSYYCGAQKLSEALLGWDLLGFHPKTAWRADGLDAMDGPGSYDPAQMRDIIPPPNGDGVPDTFDERKGPYLELATANAFRLNELFRPNSISGLQPDTFVICDVFGTKKITMIRGTDPITGQPISTTEKAGAPVLYYRANTSGKIINNVYRASDNDALVVTKQQDDGRVHPLAEPSGPYQFFYDYIRDPKITAKPWPYRPDSYILISAGADGLYGTSDDIRNFGN